MHRWYFGLILPLIFCACVLGQRTRRTFYFCGTLKAPTNWLQSATNPFQPADSAKLPFPGPHIVFKQMPLPKELQSPDLGVPNKRLQLSRERFPHLSSRCQPIVGDVDENGGVSFH